MYEGVTVEKETTSKIRRYNLEERSEKIVGEIVPPQNESRIGPDGPNKNGR